MAGRGNKLTRLVGAGFVVGMEEEKTYNCVDVHTHNPERHSYPLVPEAARSGPIQFRRISTNDGKLHLHLYENGDRQGHHKIELTHQEARDVLGTVSRLMLDTHDMAREWRAYIEGKAEVDEK